MSHTYLGRPPAALFDGRRNGRTVTLVDDSTDSDGQVVAWSWNFGDNSTSTERNPTHTYAAAGNYTITLTVTDNTGQTNAFSRPVQIT